jgi:outer membrane protein
LLSAKYDERAAGARLSAAKAEYGPTISVRAGVGYQRITDPFQPHGYTPQNSVSVVLTQPLFTGGLVRSRVRQSAEDNAAALDLIDDARRNVARDVEQAWARLSAARMLLSVNQERVEQAKAAFAGVQIESRAGLRTTLDVLNAAQELNSADLAVAAADHDAYLSGVLLLQATGHLEIKALAPTAASYDPKVNFQQLKGLGALAKSPIKPASENRR